MDSKKVYPRLSSAGGDFFVFVISDKTEIYKEV